MRQRQDQVSRVHPPEIKNSNCITTSQTMDDCLRHGRTTFVFVLGSKKSICKKCKEEIENYD
jgi:hypothetical protein